MSTILKALQELEKRGAPVTQAEPAWDDWGLRWRWVVAALLVLTGGGGLAVFLLGRNPPRPQSVTAPVPIARSQVEPLQPARDVPRAAPRVAPPPAVRRQDEPPQGRGDRGRVAAAAPVAPAVAPPAPLAHNRAAQRPKAQHKAPEAQAAVAPRASVSSDSGIEVRSITYSPDPAKRVVTIRIGGTRVVKLHEGESAGAIEVQLINRGTVYLRQGGSVFAVGVP